MSARVLLLQPPYRTHVVSPPIGLGYLASFLRERGHDVFLADLNLNRPTRAGFEDILKKSAADLVGLSCMSTGTEAVRELVRVIRSVLDVPVVIGGAQVSALPEYTLRFTEADFIVVGEGEHTLAELVERLAVGGSAEGVQGLGFLDGEEFKLNPGRPLIEDLDSLPMPAWDLIPPASYRIAPIITSAKKFPIAPLLTSRGCPFACVFCAGQTIWGKTYRRRDPIAVVDEMEMLLGKYGIREIFLSDDNFNLKKSHAESVCTEILGRGMEFPWSCPNGLRVDLLPFQLLGLLRRAGCHMIGLGIESSSQEILDRAKKSLDVSVVPGVCADITRVGMDAVGFFVIGLPGETVDTIENTIRFARSLPIKRAAFTILAPYPGSELFEQYVKDIGLDGITWSCIDTVGKDVAQLSSLTPEELDYYQKKAARSFYLRPSILFDLVISQRPSTIRALFSSQFVRNIMHRKKSDEGTFR